MAEVSALRKHPCPECGGDTEWNATKQALACPYCGTVLPSDASANPEIPEHDLEAALANPRHHGIQTEKQSVQCESCHAISIFDPGRAAQRCDFCASPAILPAENALDLIPPESLLPAVVPAPQVRDTLRAWYGSRWWAPNALKRLALTDTLHGIYLPYWTFDAQVDAFWTAESGYYYHTTETYRDSNGKTATRQVRKIRWQPSSGQLSHFFNDDLVPGTVGVHPTLLRKVEPFPTTEDLKPYDPAYVRGWTVERYQVDLRLASQTSKKQMDLSVRQLCSREVPGDTHRNLQIESTYHNRTFKHILVPVWLVSYTYGKKSYQVVVNAYTGTIAGEHPLSWIKILSAILATCAVILIILAIASQP